MRSGAEPTQAARCDDPRKFNRGALPLVELSVKTRRNGTSRLTRVRFTGPRMRPIGKIATLVLAGLITALIVQAIR